MKAVTAMARVGGFAKVETWVWNSFGTYRMSVRAWGYSWERETDAATRFFAEDLFTSHPTIFINEADPILEDFQTKGVVPSPDL